MNGVDRGHWVVRTPGFSQRVPVRIWTCAAALLMVAVAAAAVALCLGDYRLGLGQVLAALVGDGDDFTRTVVWEWRLPVSVSAVALGAMLGLGGAIFQSLTRNPLGSPDVIGFDAGSYTAVVLTMLAAGVWNYWTVAFASISGGLLTACAVYLLAYRRGMQGFRLIIVGIAVSAMLGSVNAYLITRADIDDAMAVGFWGAGSITTVGWKTLLPSLALVVVISLAAAALTPALRRLDLGDDAATALGTRVNSARVGLLVTGVATTALVTAVAGPIGFIALAAPQIARRLTRSAGVSLVASSAMGAALLSVSHLLTLVLAQWYRPVPVGLLTVCLGGSYLIWLLVREARRQYGPMT